MAIFHFFLRKSQCFPFNDECLTREPFLKSLVWSSPWN